MASIYSKRGILYLSYYVTDDDGKNRRVHVSLRLKDNRENRKVANRIKTEKEYELLQPNKLVLKYNINLETAYKLYTMNKADLAANTKSLNDTSYMHLTNFVSPKKLVKSITKSDFDRFEKYLRVEKGLKVNSAACYFRQLGVFWNWLVSEKYIPENVVKVIRHEVKPIETIPDDDIKIILNYLREKSIHQYRFVKFLQYSGFRKGEAVLLNWRDIDFEENVIHLKNQKGKRIDSFPLYERLREFMMEFRKNEGSVFGYRGTDSLKFWDRANSKLTEDDDNPEIVKFGRLKRKYTLHQIRKTFATNLVNKSVSVFDAMKLLRHRKVTTTLKYYAGTEIQRLGEEANKIFEEKGELNGNHFDNKEHQTATNEGERGVKDGAKIYKIG